jgi:ParB/Sulfiredoxin domain
VSGTAKVTHGSAEFDSDGIVPDSASPAHGPVELIQVSELVLAESPRLSGEDAAHVERLAEVEQPLPPILVYRPTMQVIDGMHRVRAAMRRGDSRIRARFFEGAQRDAFVLSVRLNIAHGLPLTLADRKAAAVRVISLCPLWSDRRVAATVGLSDKTVASIR